MLANLNADKVFISYAWSNEEHQVWVVELAKRLVSNGVEVVLDVWDSVEGHNLNAFMQKCVDDPTITKVLVICDEEYSKKANDFKGGVGTETLIISNQFYQDQDVEQTKFVPIITEKNSDGEAYIPTYLKGSKYIDMSSKQKYEEGYEALLRNLYGKPQDVRPELGKPPSYLFQEEKEVRLVTHDALSKYKRQVERNPKKIEIHFNEFMESFKDNFVGHSIVKPLDGNLKVQVFENLHETIELRDLFIDFMIHYIKESDDVDVNLIIDFFETLYPLIYTKNSSTFLDAQFDHLKFLTMELMIYTICLLYKYKEYSTIKEMVKNRYLVENDMRHEIDGHLGLFRFFPRLIEEGQLTYYAEKYKSYSGKLIIDRANFKGITAEELIEADFLILLLSYHFNKLDQFSSWSSPTIPYFTTQNQKMLSKLKSKRFFNEIKELFNMSDIEEMRELITKFKEYLIEYAKSGGINPYTHNGIIEPDEIGKL